MNPALGYISIAAVSIATALVGFYGLRVSRTTSDFYVASRTVRPWWNASAIGGEYLSAASFLGIAGLILLSGSDAFWFPIGYAAGFLMLLLFVAAPLRRSGAYTLPDFVEARLESLTARRISSALVIIVGWFYIVPQLQGAALTVRITTGLPPWVGSVAVAVIVAVIVAAGGMRSITFVQAFQYWLKLTAIAVPVIFLALITSDGSTPALDPAAAFPASDRPGSLDAYRTISLMIGLLLGTLGLPHVLVRFYTNSDGVAARRTTVIVIALISVFYAFPTAFGLLGRMFAPDLAEPGTAESVVLLLPDRLVPGPLGDALTALIIGGAFAAFLSTSSGLVVSLAGVISQELLGGSVRGFRIAAIASSLVPLAVALLTQAAGLAGSVGLVFAFAASTLGPVLLLGVWWRGLTARGASAGMITGGLLCGGAILVGAPIAQAVPALAALLEQPAAWTVPIAAGVTVLVSRATRDRAPAGVDRFLARLHVPER
ncbi:sodium/solute symporter [Agromyces atrinae]|uniref:Cation acetate symporter n=1 Tax=Agromyces atrinae TaxID=592376 RepID=A0A4V1R2M6_9MICO|nr:cation acetate symporter [Agromyces atrinae]NYD68172.1 Na+(H+)/acetate symporter ActP [Agromyces atrinae]RXZ87686.1 cation acetate symporter [Agromyces atrinae]